MRRFISLSLLLLAPLAMGANVPRLIPEGVKLDTIHAKGSTGVKIKSSSGTDVLAVGDAGAVAIGPASSTQYQRLNGYVQGNYGGTSSAYFVNSTADGADSAASFVAGAGDAGAGRGAYIGLYGNENTTHPGKIRFLAGLGASGGTSFEFVGSGGGVIGSSTDTGVWTFPAQSTRIGSNTGNYLTPTRENTNIRLYDISSSNWAGIGASIGGQIYFVTGITSPSTAMVIGTDSGVTWGAAGSSAAHNANGSLGVTGPSGSSFSMFPAADSNTYIDTKGINTSTNGGITYRSFRSDGSNLKTLGTFDANGIFTANGGIKGSTGTTTPCSGCMGQRLAANTTNGSTSTTTYTAVTDALVVTGGTWDISATISFGLSRPTGSGIQGCSLRIRNATDASTVIESLTGGATPSDPATVQYHTVHLKNTVTITASKTFYVEIAAGTISGSPTFGACAGNASYGKFEAVRRD